MIYVTYGKATFGLVVDGPPYVVALAPPIARWTVDKPARTVWAYYEGKGAVVRWIG